MKGSPAITSENFAYYHAVKYSSLHHLEAPHKMHGIKRVITFCLLIVALPTTLIIIPLYLRHSVFADVNYAVAESDIIEIREGISTVFCQRHSLKMNSSFNAFQLPSRPKASKNRKHIRLKKSMTLPDDTLEYWGFYLLKGATVELKVCSRYEGSRILVIKGERNLRTCGLLEHTKDKFGAHFAEGHEKVKVTFETVEEIHGSNINHNIKPTTMDLIFDDEDEEINNHASEQFENDNDRLNINNTANIKNSKFVLGAMNQTNITLDDINNQNLPKFRHRRHHKGTLVNNLLNEYKETVQHRNPDNKNILKRFKRDHVYDRKVSHGGNAFNFEENNSDSISSFENGLLNCYDGQILLAQGFPPSPQCSNIKFLESGARMITKHNVTEDGYYYYIFYSDNDIVRNDIYAIFDIHKPTFQYSNITDSGACVNATNCTFNVNFLSDDIVIVEIPTRDGIERDEDDISSLISTCHPRLSIYLIFPVTVLFLIVGCAFL